MSVHDDSWSDALGTPCAETGDPRTYDGPTFADYQRLRQRTQYRTREQQAELYAQYDHPTEHDIAHHAAELPPGDHVLRAIAADIRGNEIIMTFVDEVTDEHPDIIDDVMEALAARVAEARAAITDAVDEARVRVLHYSEVCTWPLHDFDDTLETWTLEGHTMVFDGSVGDEEIAAWHEILHGAAES